MCGANTCWPMLSSRNDDLRYSEPPLIAPTKCPIRPDAIGASNSTGALRVVSLTAFNRRTQRSPAIRPTASAFCISPCKRLDVYQ